jgi:hypothetical protein
MSQSTKIFGVLILLFFVYITLKGQLAAYKAVFGLGGTA